MIDGVGIAAIITAIGASVVAVIGAFRVQSKASQNAEANPAALAEHELPPVPEKFDGAEVLDFLKEVRKDNVDLRARDAAKDIEIKGLKTTLDDMNVELQGALKIRDAFARWTPALFRAWGKTNTPPLPEGDDLVTLQDFIPRT